MHTYTLDIGIGPSQCEWPRENQYKLCIMRQINDRYIIVRQGGDIHEHNTFEWSEEFQVFWGNLSPTGILLEGCSPQPIAYGQTVIVNGDSSMGSATGEPDNSGKFTIINKYSKEVRVRINTKEGDSWTTYYVSPAEVAVGSTTVITSHSSVKIWFEVKAKTGSTTTEIITESHTVGFEGTTSRMISFKGDKSGGSGKWIDGPLPE
ncbi:hypothetical protein M408DRAFT_26506 [Serendipita vermifera MAFF 305830]|uniref:Uncharacterized protein n=1 Tax=Serendipita vermifera MAFF 305830 TaxID=933852 RepID=A0A0C3AKN8_SERVB|nr:hypothetical protein M408DRAFT_26506 [Serendipita vermifera MAFF 305830]